jgi:hypothetical protein
MSRGRNRHGACLQLTFWLFGEDHLCGVVDDERGKIEQVKQTRLQGQLAGRSTVASSSIAALASQMIEAPINKCLRTRLFIERKPRRGRVSKRTHRHASGSRRAPSSGDGQDSSGPQRVATRDRSHVGPRMSGRAELLL